MVWEILPRNAKPYYQRPPWPECASELRRLLVAVTGRGYAARMTDEPQDTDDKRDDDVPANGTDLPSSQSAPNADTSGGDDEILAPR